MKKISVMVWIAFYSAIIFAEEQPFQLVAKLSGEKLICDAAYAEIINSTKENECIGLLILNGSNTNIYKGAIWYNPFSSRFGKQPRVGTVSLYLVDAIIGRENDFCSVQSDWIEEAPGSIESKRVKFPYLFVPHPHLLPVIFSKLEFSEKNLEETSLPVLKSAQALYADWWISIGCKKPEDEDQHPFNGTPYRWY